MASKKVIKKADGEPLNRVDLQFDLLQAIFNDQHQVFTDPFPANGRPVGSKVTFRDLYVNAIYNSPKSSKVLKDKMNDIPDFATDFAMMTLLANVGRINTTMSFFVEMKTAIRTYHPVPALQKTSGSLQDAPRLKAIAKASFLEEEASAPPSSLTDILSRAKSGRVPSTSVANLIFTLANETTSISTQFLSSTYDFVDLFLPIEVSSLSRARVFLWLCYHYLESPSLSNSDEDDYDTPDTPDAAVEGQNLGNNPFCDPNRPGKPPSLIMLTTEEASLENVDSEEEKAIADRLVKQRVGFLQMQSLKESNKDKSESKGSKEGKGNSNNKGTGGGDDAESVVSMDVDSTTGVGGGSGAGVSVGGGVGVINFKSENKAKAKKSSKKTKGKSGLAHAIGEGDDVHEGHGGNGALTSDERKSLESRSRSQNQYTQDSRGRYAPYPISTREREQRSVRYRERRHSPPRTILEHAWHVFTHSDPLCDSDDEDMVDEHYREDYLQKLRIITQIRGKPPTPEPEELGSVSVPVTMPVSMQVPARSR